MTFESKTPEKPIDEYHDWEIKEMFVELFFWVADNRPDWLAECISRKKTMMRAKT